MSAADDPVMSLAAIAAYAGTSVDTIRRAMRRGEDNPQRLQGHLRAGRLTARRSEVNRWLDAIASPVS